MKYRDYLVNNQNDLDIYFSNLSGDRGRSTDVIWEIYKCYGLPGYMQFSAFEKISVYRLEDKHSMEINASYDYISEKLSEVGLNYSFTPHLLKRLYKDRFISAYHYNDCEMVVHFANEDAAIILTHASIIPAMKVAKTSLFARFADGRYIVDKLVIGLHEYEYYEFMIQKARKDTIVADAMLLCRDKPVFIKCEYSIFPLEILDTFYEKVKLYGGDKAMMLVTVSLLDDDTEFAGELARRTEELGMKLIINIAEMDDDLLLKNIEQAIG